MPHPQNRTVSRNRSRRRRYSACHRHPDESVTGFCALCLRDRLAGLDSCSPSPAPELRRSKSVAVGKREVFNDLDSDRRRKSCDVRARSSLSDLFVVDDNKKARDHVSVNLGFSGAGDEIRVSDDVDNDDEFEIGDLKTMKEIIEMEMDNKRRNFWNTASVFSQKLRKWRQKQKEKKERTDNNIRSKLGLIDQIRDNQSEAEEYKLGRRSCDTEPRFSTDGHRLSVEDSRLSFDEHRASWDGYMIARTIPRLTPMLSVVDNRATAIMEKRQMQSISEDGASSGQSVSDCFTSNIGSSSSSSTKTVGLGDGGDDVKSASNAQVSPANDVIFQGTKLVITEKELKDWHLNNSTESVSKAPDSTGKTTVTNSISRWKRVCNLWGQKHKVGDKKNVEDVPENRSVNLVRNPGLVSLRNKGTRYSTSDLDSGLLRLYLTPFRNSRRNKYGKSRAPSMGTSGLQLN